jgi:hypothetical protein
LQTTELKSRVESVENDAITEKLTQRDVEWIKSTLTEIKGQLARHMEMDKK